MSGRIDTLMTFTQGVKVQKSFTCPNSQITEAMCSTPFSASAVKAQHCKTYSQKVGTVVADDVEVIHAARSAGSIVSFCAGHVGPNTGGNTVSVELKKNGTTVLSAAISLDSGDAAYAQVDATIATAAYSAGDVFTIHVDQSSGTGDGTGFFAELVVDETADTA